MTTPDNYLKPYAGRHADSFDNTTLHGKVMCGYQGWFRAPGDEIGSNKWVHWQGRGGKFEPGCCSIDLWPDLSEYDADELYETPFKHADGSTAKVFSSGNKKTVMRHVKWVKDYGIDGLFQQRFFNVTTGEDRQRANDYILTNLREASNTYGTTYALMYDLSGMGANQYQSVIDDWKRLVDTMQLSRDPNDHAYLQHNGKPVVTLWGIGFNDNRKYSLQDCLDLVTFLKDDPVYGQNTVMIGVPTGWRDQCQDRPYAPYVEKTAPVMDGDSVVDPLLHEICKKADIVSPWAVDRIVDQAGAQHLAETIWKDDIAWLESHGSEFMPVVFPGFSWHNLNTSEPINQIPRRKGAFLEAQYEQAIKQGVPFIYQAMFDEVDEATAVFKCTNNPPVGESPFLNYEGLDSDHYLKLIGRMGQKLREQLAQRR